MRLSSLGEFGLIDRIAKKINVKKSRVKIGIGDDAAVIKTSKNTLVILTTDTLIEDVHFDLRYFSFFFLGWKALAANISDVISMGGTPTEALISLGLPKNVKVESVDELYSGIKKLARKYGISIAGGDIVSSPRKIVIGITVLGEAKKKNILLRKGAKVGEVILVSGDIGASALGLALLKKKKVYRKKNYAIKKHLSPKPRVKEARIIAESRLATSMIDLSDGLVRSLIEIGKSSNVGSLILLDALPIRREIKELSNKLGKSVLDFALYGGEDYELLVTCKKKDALRLSSLVKRKTGTPLTILGEITEKSKGIKVKTPSERIVPLKGTGYEHFKVR